MTLTTTRAAFEKAITDAVASSNPAIKIIYDNIPYTLTGKTKKYLAIKISFSQSTIQAQGAAVDFYTGTIQCNLYVPRNKGTSEVSAMGEAVIDGLVSVNKANYVDTYSCNPKVSEVAGPLMVESEQESHYLGIISCQFSANA